MPIYIYKNNQQFGPFEDEKVVEMLRNGQLSPDDQALRSGQNQWQPLRVLFPNASPVFNNQLFNIPPTPDNRNQFQQKKSGSKVWIFALLGLGAFFVLGIAGLLGLFFYLGNRAPIPASSDSAKTSDPKSDAKPQVKDFKAIQNKAEEFARLSPAKKAIPNPQIKGKIAIVEKGKYEAKILGFDYEGKEYSDTDLDKYGISKTRLAVNPQEIDTLIQILCSKGKLIGQYEGGIPGYASECKVSLIDYKTPAVIAEQTFVNSTPPPKISSVYTDEFIFPASNDVEEYIGNFPLEKLTSPLPEMPFDDRDGYYGKYKPFMDWAGELSRTVFPVKLDSNASLKGKIAVAIKHAEGRAELKGFDVYGKEISYDAERWGIDKNRMAEKPEDIDTLIQINCKKGSRLGTVKKTAVFANQCDLAVVDYKSSAVVFQKKLENNEMRRDVDTDIYPTRYIVLYPTTEIDDFIKGFPKS